MATSKNENVQSPLPNPTIHVTGHNGTGKAVVQSSTQNEHQAVGSHGATLNLVYTTSCMPVDLNNDADIKQHEKVVASGKLGLVNPNGTVARFVDFAPSSIRTAGMMHRTQSLDYGLVVEGEMIMELDDGSRTVMKKGDVAVQRATSHAWVNASDTEWARMFFVLQDCQPLTVGGKRMKEDLGSGSEIFHKSGND
jgi:quercetin dioxygenase-like cupin family protein